MRLAKTVTSTAAAASLFDLVANSDQGSNGILLRLASGTVSFGNRSAQPIPLTATPIVIPSNNTKGIFLVGAGTVDVALF